MYQKVLTFCILMICAYTDIRYRKIYTWSLILYGVLALGGRVFAGMTGGVQMKTTGAEAALGLLPGIACIALSWISRQALEYGDSVLITVCGISLGAMDCLQVLFTAFLFSGAYGLVWITVRKRSRKAAMPFVPFLFLGMLVTGGG